MFIQTLIHRQNARCEAEIQRRLVNKDDNDLENVAEPSSESTNRYTRPVKK